MTLIWSWLNATRATYFGNATAVRDYRTQLRGTKAFWLWGAYLALLILICGFAYNQFADQGSQSIAELQAQLTMFYHVVIGMLGGVVVLVAPGLTAAAITTERQRRSLDLVFSAPVKPRYLLVGKMIAGMRYLVMLLILALPVVSVCVVMGGATWSDVIGAFINLLNCGIIMLAIGLLMSCIVPTTIGAILSSYAVITLYCIGTGGLASFALAGLGSGRTGPHSYEAPWYGNIVPFTASLSAPTFTKVFSYDMPNWVIGFLFSIVVSKLLLAGAGSSLSPFGSAETKSLRIHGLVACFAVMFLLAAPVAQTFASRLMGSIVGPTGAPPSAPAEAVMMFLGYATCCTFFLWPHMMCHSREGERKFWNDGVMSLRGAFRGTPSGSWPYLMMLIGAMALGLYLGVQNMSSTSMMTPPPTSVTVAPTMIGGPGGPVATPTPSTPISAHIAWSGIELGTPFLTMLIWCMGFVTLWWGFGRFTSATAGNLKGARLGLISTMVILVAIPTPIFSVIAQSHFDTTGIDPIWNFHVMYPLFAQNAQKAQAYYGLGCAILGFLFAFLGEKKYRSKYPVTNDV